MNRDAIYKHLPVPAQNLACSFEGWRLNRKRYGRGYEALEREYRARSAWAPERIRQFRDDRLREFSRRAIEDVPYYRSLPDDVRLSMADVRSVEDLHVLPTLSKERVRADPAPFMSDAFPRRSLATAHTSGTTGAGLRFATTIQATREQWAVWWRYRGWHGITRDAWCGYFGGRSVVPADDVGPPFWRYNRASKQILFSAYHLSPSTASSYAAELRKRKPPWLHGYPSMLSLFAGLVVEQGLDIGYQVRWVTLGAENLLDHQRELLTRAFGVVPRQNYGMAEAVANASECPRGRLHVDEDFAVVESVTDTTTGSHKIVGTNLSNPAFPLIRYEVGDVGLVQEGSCGCGLPGRLLVELDGRKEDFVILADGARLGRLDHVFKDLVHVREAQFHQQAPGRVTVLVVKRNAYSADDHEKLETELRDRMGARMNCRIEYVERIPRTKSGKLRLVVSELAEGRLSSGSV